MNLEVTLKKSLIGRKPNHVQTAHSLGLFKVGQVVLIENVTPSIMGKLKQLYYLVETKEV